MKIDDEGHVLLSPREFQERLDNQTHLINDIWLAGTPCAFPTYHGWCDLLKYFADNMGIHPRNIVVRGSTKLGFSIVPGADKVWMQMRPDSDIDFAIVDPDYYHLFDREFRHYERLFPKEAFRGAKGIGRQKSRAYYTYRYHDFPDIECVRSHLRYIASAPVEKCCGASRTLNAFLYRDWWSLHARCAADLYKLRCGLADGLPHGEGRPRIPKVLQSTRSSNVKDSGKCNKCGRRLEVTALSWSPACPNCYPACF